MAQGQLLTHHSVSDGSVSDIASMGNGEPTKPSFVDNSAYQVFANTVYTVSMSAYLALGISGNEGGGTLTGSAFIEAQFLAAPGYTLDLSSGEGTDVGAPNLNGTSSECTCEIARQRIVATMPPFTTARS
jgi:hypothetical protein